MQRYLERFPGIQILVVGDAILDSYLTGTADRLCREAPVPVIAVGQAREASGAAANTAANVAALGGRVTFLAAVGDDAEGLVLRARLGARR